MYLTCNLATNTVSQYHDSSRADPELEVPVARLNLPVPAQQKTAFDYLADANLQAMVNAAARPATAFSEQMAPSGCVPGQALAASVSSVA